MNIGQRIKMRRKELGKSAEQIADILGVSPATVYRYESNDIMNMRIDKLAPIAKALHTTPAYLMGWETDGHSVEAEQENTIDIRFLGDVAAGFNHQAIEEYETLIIPAEWIRGRSPDDYFAMRVIGSSMYPEYRDGDEILCRKCVDMGRSGLVGVFICPDGEATLKRINYVKGEDWVELEPINPEYEPKRIEGYELEQCRVIGRAIRLIRTLGS